MNKEFQVSISLVVYKNNPKELKGLFNGLTALNLKSKIFIIDNSPTDTINSICNKEFIYIHNKKNIGFGRAHNIAMKQAAASSEYHLVINPDICFKDRTIEDIYAFMEANPQIGMVMPKILYTDGLIQYSCRLFPTPFDLMLRKIYFPFFTKRQNHKYELQFANYDNILDIPFLSGCFMFIRSSALEKVGVFDERFFMYFEDVDLCRRVHRYFRTVYYPGTSAVHTYEKSPESDSKLFLYHLISATKYFNKWGWFFDKERRRINKETLERIGQKNNYD